MSVVPQSSVLRAHLHPTGRLDHLPRSGQRIARGMALAVALSTLALVACGDKAANGHGQMPPPQVGVIKVQLGSAPLVSELTGRLEPLRTAQVRARVTGVVQRRLFTEGGAVKAGQSLFLIDAAPYQAALNAANAALARADAALALAQANAERNRTLADARAISAQDWSAIQTALKAAQADRAAAAASAQQARLNVGYAAVPAPISGRIGRAMVTEGAYVNAAEATLLATVQQTDTLLVSINQSAGDAMALRRALAQGQVQGQGAHVPVQVQLEDGRIYAHPGKLLFTDPTVDAATGQVLLRAEVPNPDGELLPGLLVRVRLAQASTPNAARVPKQAVTRGSAGDSVLVVGAKGVPSQRQVQLGAAADDDWIVLDGLKAGEQVVVDGFQKIQPQQPVTPVPWTPKPASAASAPKPAV